MKIPSKSNFIILACLMLGMVLVFSQNNKTNTTKEKIQLENILKTIEQTEKLLLEAKKNKLGSLKQIELMNSQISYRKELLNTLEQEMTTYQNEIKLSSYYLNQKQDHILKLQKEYIQLLKKKLIDKATFNPILSLVHHENMENRLKRWYLIQWVEKNMLHALKTLDTSQQSLIYHQWNLKIKTIKQDSLIQQSNDEFTCLEEDIKDVRQMMSNFENLESHLLKELIAYKKKKEEIGEIISGSIKFLNLNATKASTKREALKMVFPVDFPIITSRFGKNMESGNPNLLIRNNGLDIQSSSPFVKSAEQAEVIQIRKLPTADYLVITKSGPYYLVYSNLQSVLLKEREKLNKIRP
ncbi:MAG: hypothetical protein IPM92_01855 [Saprospiraceae bacterium]|nr:hypothetical protein [Saprospiraceae bacterium]